MKFVLKISRVIENSNS